MAFRKNARDRLHALSAPVEIKTVGGHFVLTIGPVSLLLDRDVAEEIMCLIADSLEKLDPLDLSPSGSN